MAHWYIYFQVKECTKFRRTRYHFPPFNELHNSSSPQYQNASHATRDFIRTFKICIQTLRYMLFQLFSNFVRISLRIPRLTFNIFQSLKRISKTSLPFLSVKHFCIYMHGEREKKRKKKREKKEKNRRDRNTRE